MHSDNQSIRYRTASTVNGFEISLRHTHEILVGNANLTCGAVNAAALFAVYVAKTVVHRHFVRLDFPSGPSITKLLFVFDGTVYHYQGLRVPYQYRA